MKERKDCAAQSDSCCCRSELAITHNLCVIITDTRGIFVHERILDERAYAWAAAWHGLGDTFVEGVSRGGVNGAFRALVGLDAGGNLCIVHLCRRCDGSDGAVDWRMRLLLSDIHTGLTMRALMWQKKHHGLAASTKLRDGNGSASTSRGLERVFSLGGLKCELTCIA